MKARHHLLDIFATELHLVFTKGQWKRLDERIGSLGEAPERPQLAVTIADIDDEGQFHVTVYVDVEAHVTQMALIGTLAHEAAHAADFIHAHHQVQSPGPQDEARAYLIGWLTTWMAEHINETS